MNRVEKKCQSVFVCRSKVESINSQGKIREIRKIDAIIRLSIQI